MAGLLDKEQLRVRQEEMRERNEQINKARRLALLNRPKCTICNNRFARLNSPYCSRCSSTKQISQLRDQLPGTVKSTVQEVEEQGLEGVLGGVEEQVQESPPSTVLQPGMKTYTRAEVAVMLGISATTLMRWERKGKVDQPLRVASSKQCVYTDDMVKKVREYMGSYYLPPVVTTSPGTIESLPRAVKKSVKINRALEKAVARQLGKGLFRR